MDLDEDPEEIDDSDENSLPQSQDHDESGEDQEEYGEEEFEE